MTLKPLIIERNLFKLQSICVTNGYISPLFKLALQTLFLGYCGFVVCSLTSQITNPLMLGWCSAAAFEN